MSCLNPKLLNSTCSFNHDTPVICYHKTGPCDLGEGILMEGGTVCKEHPGGAGERKLTVPGSDLLSLARLAVGCVSLCEEQVLRKI